MVKFKIKISDLIRILLCITIYSTILFMTFDRNPNHDFYIKSLCYIDILISICLVFRFRTCRPFFILFLMNLYFIYSITIGFYINPIESKLYTSFTDKQVWLISLFILTLFLNTLFLFTTNKANINEFKQYNFNNKGNDTFIVFFLQILLILIFIFGFDRPEVLNERGSPSTFYEYSVMIFIIIFYLSGRNRFYIISTSFLLILFALQNFIYGGRIMGLQLLIVFYLFYLMKKISTKTVILITCLGIFCLNAIAVYRNTFSLFTFADIVNYIERNNLALDTCVSANYTSLTFLRSMSFTSNAMRIGMLNKFILSIFTGNSLINNLDLTSYTRQYFLHYYGGIVPYYFYFYLGYPGVLIISAIVSKYFAVCHKYLASNRDFIKILSIYLIATFPRWFLYTPINLFRGCLILFLFYKLIELLNKFIRSRNKSYVNGIIQNQEVGCKE